MPELDDIPIFFMLYEDEAVLKRHISGDFSGPETVITLQSCPWRELPSAINELPVRELPNNLFRDQLINIIELNPSIEEEVKSIGMEVGIII